MHKKQDSASARQFLSTLLIAFGPWPLIFGWLFLAAGTGGFLLLAGLAMEVAGVLLWPTVRRAGAALAAIALGCSPVVFIVVWVLAGA